MNHLSTHRSRWKTRMTNGPINKPSRKVTITKTKIAGLKLNDGTCMAYEPSAVLTALSHDRQLRKRNTQTRSRRALSAKAQLCSLRSHSPSWPSNHSIKSCHHHTAQWIQVQSIINQGHISHYSKSNKSIHQRLKSVRNGDNNLECIRHDYNLKHLKWWLLVSAT